MFEYVFEREKVVERVWLWNRRFLFVYIGASIVLKMYIGESEREISKEIESVRREVGRKGGMRLRQPRMMIAGTTNTRFSFVVDWWY